MAIFKEILRNDGSGITRFYRIDNGSITTLDYDALINKPKINGKELIGDILIDISDFDLSNYYTKKETNTTIQTQLANYYTKKETDNQITKRITEVSAPDVDLTDYYTKAETEALVTEKIEEAAGQDTDLTNYYTKAETETLVEEKIGEVVIPEVDLTGYYTKTETEVLIDEKIDGIEIPTTDLSNYYNKEETEAKIDEKLQGFEVPSTDLSNYYDKTQTDTKIDEKINAIPISDLLHDVGHYTTEDELPSVGQPSGLVTGNQLVISETYANNYVSEATVNGIFRVNALKSGYQYILGVTDRGDSYPSTGAVFTNFKECIDGIAIIGSGTNPSRISVHITPSQGKQVFTKFSSGMNNAGFKMPCVYYDDGTQINTTTAGATLEITKPGWVCLCRSNAYNAQIIGNIGKSIKFIKHPDTLYYTKLSEYTIEAVSVTSPDTITIQNHNYNYVDGYFMLTFVDGQYLKAPSWYLGEPEAKVNDIATVGENNELYKCYTGPQWKKVGGIDTYSKEEIDNMIGDINTVLTEIVEGGE